MFAISTAGGPVGGGLTPALQRRFRLAAIFRAAAVMGVAGAAAFLLAPAVSASLSGTLSAECPDALVGRAQVSLTLLVCVAAPVAPVVTGLLADRWSAVAVISGIAALFAALAAAFAIPAFGASRTD